MTVRLQDSDDDVQAVAAEALLPVAHLLADDPSEPAAHLLRLLWDSLLVLEDLSPATGSIMALLTELYSRQAAEAPRRGVGLDGVGGEGDSGWSRARVEGEGALGELAPRLWPFLRHGLASVRRAALRCFGALVRRRGSEGVVPGAELGRAARLLFQELLLEQEGGVLAQGQETWKVRAGACGGVRLCLMGRDGERAALVGWGLHLLSATLPAERHLTCSLTVCLLDAIQVLIASTQAQLLSAHLPSEVLAGFVALSSTPVLKPLNPALCLPFPQPAGRKQGGARLPLQRQRGEVNSAEIPRTAAEAGRAGHAEGGEDATARRRLAAAKALGQLAHVFAAAGRGPGATCNGGWVGPAGARVCSSM
jgi:hypothetical protein